eukprot:2670685-Pyramimonas_sp.AAC.1
MGGCQRLGRLTPGHRDACQRVAKKRGGPKPVARHAKPTSLTVAGQRRTQHGLYLQRDVRVWGDSPRREAGPAGRGPHRRASDADNVEEEGDDDDLSLIHI